MARNDWNLAYWIFPSVILTAILLVGGVSLAADSQSQVWSIGGQGDSNRGFVFGYGPYQTTYVSLWPGKESIIPAGVSFSKNRLGPVFDISRGRSVLAHVQTGQSEPKSVKKIGFVRIGTGRQTVGSITRGKQVVGRFEFLPVPSTMGVPKAPKAGQAIHQSRIETPAGVINSYKRQSQTNRSAMQKFFKGQSLPTDEYRLNGRVVARRGGEHLKRTIWFAPDLAEDARVCIVAENAVRLRDECLAQIQANSVTNRVVVPVR